MSSHRNISDNLILGFLLILGITLIPFHGHIRGWALYAILHLVIFWILLEGLRFIHRNRSGWTDTVHALYPILFTLLTWVGLKYMITLFFENYYGTSIIQEIEKQLFRGEFPTIWIRHWFNPLFDELMNGIYTLYYLLFIGVPVTLYRIGEKEMSCKLIFVLCLNHILFFMIFILFPVEGPKTAVASGADPAMNTGIFSSLIMALQKVFSIRGAAFPSLHVAGSFCISWILIKKWFWPGLSMMLFSLVMIPATVYCQYHYAVDGIAAFFLSIPVFAAGSWFFDRYNRIHESA